MKWYTFKPADTLFFRGAQPMNIGENHTASAYFPPPAQTLVGALRTAMLNQNGIALTDYYENKIDADMMTLLGAPEQAPGFNMIGPLFRKNGVNYIPAPYTWFTDKAQKDQTSVTVYKSFALQSDLIQTSGTSLAWAKGKSGVLTSLGGKWIEAGALHTHETQVHFRETHAFFDIEPRTGIALTPNRGVREGHLYSFNHARLKPDVSILFGVDKALPLAEKGLLKLGAEQRFGVYRAIDPIHFQKGASGLFMALAMVLGSETTNAAVIASGKIQYIGGWDLKKGFHKPMQGWFPSGSVFNQKLNVNFIEL